MKQKKLKQIGKIKEGEDLVYETDKYVYNFQQYETIRSFGKYIFAGKITLDNADKDQSNLLNEFIDSNKTTKPRDKKRKS